MFNVLGPLINPARLHGMVLGAAEPEIGPTVAESLGEGGVERAPVVCRFESLDEISCAGPAHAWELRGGATTPRVLRPADFGLPEHLLSAVAGGSPQENAAAFTRCLLDTLVFKES